MSAATVDRVVCRWPTTRARQWTLGFLRRAQADTNVAAVIAIGSAVRDNVPSADLDLLVLCRERDTLSERAPIEVDLRVYDVDDVDRQVANGRDLLTWAVLFGRPLLDRFQTWESIVRRWRARVPLPDPSAARSRAAATLARLEVMREMGDDVAAAELDVSYQTHCARALLAEAGVHPASRPELSDQLRSLGAMEQARKLTAALTARQQLSSGGAGSASLALPTCSSA